MLAVLALLIYTAKSEVLIESVESKTGEGKAVYNKIKFMTEENKDIWLMKQNHTDLKGEWDELKIEVDKSSTPYKASYFQLKEGKEIEYRMSCYKCHANGPRLIRANYKSSKVKYSLKDRVTIMLWNLKIKHYGKVQTPQDIRIGSDYRKVPLKHTGRIDNKILNIKTCNLCHGENSFLGRSALVKQQVGTIMHLVKEKQMPPWPFKLSDKEMGSLIKQLN